MQWGYLLSPLSNDDVIYEQPLGVECITIYSEFFPHLFGKTHFYTESSYVAFTTLVCFIAHMCGNNQICVRKPHREVLGFFHTCLVKHTHVLISP